MRQGARDRAAAMTVIETQRLRLRCWRDADHDAFAALHADPEVMRDLGGPIDRAASLAKLSRYQDTYRRLGFCRWAVASPAGEVFGYAGLMPSPPIIRSGYTSRSAGA